MGHRLTEIVVDCRDPIAQASFWPTVLGYHVVRSEEGAGYYYEHGVRTYGCYWSIPFLI